MRQWHPCSLICFVRRPFVRTLYILTYVHTYIRTWTYFQLSTKIIALNAVYRAKTTNCALLPLPNTLIYFHFFSSKFCVILVYFFGNLSVFSKYQYISKISSFAKFLYSFLRSFDLKFCHKHKIPLNRRDLFDRTDKWTPLFILDFLDVYYDHICT